MLVYRDPKIMAYEIIPYIIWVVFLSPFVNLNQPGPLLFHCSIFVVIYTFKTQTSSLHRFCQEAERKPNALTRRRLAKRLGYNEMKVQGDMGNEM